MPATAHALQSAQAEVAALPARALAPVGSSSHPSSSATAAQLASERRTVQRLRASVTGSSVRLKTLLNHAELHVVETEGTLYTAVEEVFGTH